MFGQTNSKIVFISVLTTTYPFSTTHLHCAPLLNPHGQFDHWACEPYWVDTGKYITPGATLTDQWKPSDSYSFIICQPGNQGERSQNIITLLRLAEWNPISIGALWCEVVHTTRDLRLPTHIPITETSQNCGWRHWWRQIMK